MEPGAEGRLGCYALDPTAPGGPQHTAELGHLGSYPEQDGRGSCAVELGFSPREGGLGLGPPVPGAFPVGTGD